ncbi:Gfo/Idh/MocA family protein [Mucilaginibacter lacusdianchii]|uniref:Gfo/Idh/MocA family protein n=1 Tax=Mucilaginibacter lacusdianchii TaxID=2684211 RepID=UPI00131B5F66|nr:Gfo/Idh/MocA family oxidoreductase [Mucilaginibacter sp. JXJ CY 39]
MERKTFLKNSALLAAGLFIDNKLSAMPTLAAPLKVGIVGCGDRGTGIMHIINGMTDMFQITAVCDVLDFRLAAAQKLGKSASLKAYTDYRKLLDDKEVDTVIVAVPLHMHYPVAAAVINSGRHLYLEKTMTYTIDQALDLVKLMHNRNTQVLQVGHQYRYSPLYYRVKEMINKGYLGKITQIDCRWDRNGSWRRPVPDSSLERVINWRMYKEYSGGLVAELLSHQIDFINWVFDTHPQEFFATGGIDYFKDGRETYDNVQVMLRYPELGMIGNFGATCGNAHDGYLFKIKGTLGTVSLLTDQGIFYPEKKLLDEKGTVDGVTGATRIVWNKGGGTPILPEPTRDGTWYAFKDFYTKVQNRQLPDSNVFTGARTAISVHLANQALYSNKITAWDKSYKIDSK